MQQAILRSRGNPARQARQPHGPILGLLQAALCALGLGIAPAAQAFEYGPFSLTGFVKFNAAHVNNACENCQRDPAALRHFIWADPIAFGRKFGGLTTHEITVEPTLGVKFDLPQGFKLSAAYTERLRDGNRDLPDTIYQRSITLKHEYYGTVQIGGFPSRGWNRADTPYATDLGQNAFSDSGAAYGILTNAIRYTSRELYVADGNLVLEATYAQGDTDFKRNKPQFIELWALYGRGPLLVEAVVQSARNGTPVAFAKWPFRGLTPFPDRDDRQLGSSSQGMFMLLGKYQIGTGYEVSGGIRFNRWSGAYAVQLTQGAEAAWNDPFNVDWNGVDANGVLNPGYPARTTDLMLGLRKYVNPKLVAYSGLVYFGKASTANPSERGQSNSSLRANVGAAYDFGGGFSVSGALNAVWYSRKGQAPLSLASHDFYSNIDSRIAKRGNWITFEAKYAF